MNLDLELIGGITVEDLIILSSALSALSVVILFWYALVPSDRGAKRIKLLADQRKAIKAGISGPVRRKVKERKPSTNLMHDIVARMKLLKSEQGEKVAMRLVRAGYRDKDALIYYFFLKITLPFLFCGIAAVATFGLDLYNLSFTENLLACAAGLIAGVYGPDVIIKNRTQKRQGILTKALPDTLDLMVICAEAGLSLDATLSRVSKETENNYPELSEELAITGLELGFLPERRKALANLADRTDLSVVRGLVNTLMQSERYGTPLANALRVMSSEAREVRIMKAEEKAARLPAMMTVPMIVFIMPPLFVILIGPAIITTIDAFRGLH